MTDSDDFVLANARVVNELTPGQVVEFHGRRRGFACGFAYKMGHAGPAPILEVDLPATRVLLIQVRYECGRTFDPSTIHLPKSFKDDLLSGHAKLSIEDGRLWLVHYDARHIVESQQVVDCIAAVIDALIRNGISAGGFDCDQCNRTATSTAFLESRVIQLCDLCSSQADASHCLDSHPPGLFTPQWGHVGLDALRCALTWAILTLAFHTFGVLIGNAFGIKRVHVPPMIEAFALLLAGWFIGAPLGKRIAKWRGSIRTKRFTSGAICLVSVAAGELMVALLSTRAATGSWTFESLSAFSVNRWRAEGIHIVVRLIAAGATVYAACAAIEPDIGSPFEPPIRRKNSRGSP